jgi:hypothetical protein
MGMSKKTLVASAVLATIQTFVLRSASSYNWLGPVITGAGDTALPEFYFRCPFLIGNPGFSQLRVSLMNWMFTTSGITTAGLTSFTINKMALEANGVFVPVYFGGSRSVTINPGDTDILCDVPDMATLGNAAGGSTVYVRFHVTAPASVVLPQYSQRGTYFGPAARMRLNSANTTVVNGVDGVGTFTTTGTAPTANGNINPPLVLVGIPLAAGKFVGFVGDSITLGEAQDSNYPVGVGGSNRAAYSDYATRANPIPVINFGVGGGHIRTWLGDGSSVSSAAAVTPGNTAITYAQKAAAYLKYCNIIFEQFGTNQVFSSGTGLSATFPYQPMIWQMIREKIGASGKIVRTSLFPRSGTTQSVSADKYKTYAEQTTFQEWYTGGIIDAFQQYCQSRVGAEVDYYLDYSSVRAPANGSGPNPFFWISNGVAPYCDTAGLHPLAVGYGLIYGGQARGQIDAISAMS